MKRFAVCLVDHADEVDDESVYLGLHMGETMLEAVNQAIKCAMFDDLEQVNVRAGGEDNLEAIQVDASSFDVIIRVVEIQ